MLNHVVMYRAIAAGALLVTWTFNLQFFSQPSGNSLSDFIAGGFANPAAGSLTADLGFLTMACVLWMVSEGRKLGLRHLWAYVAFSFLIAISVTFPLFLAAREEALRLRAPAH